MGPPMPLREKESSICRASAADSICGSWTTGLMPTRAPTLRTYTGKMVRSLQGRVRNMYTTRQIPTHYVNAGAFHACYDREWLAGYIIAHKGTAIYKIDTTTGQHTKIYPAAGDSSASALSEDAGNFFVYSNKLYYLGGGQYIQINTSGVATKVVPYSPIVVINRNPDGSGGNLYQPENRISAGKEIWFTSDGTSTTYKLPYNNLDSSTVSITVNNTSVTTGFTVNQTAGTVTFNTAPSQSDPAVANNVKIVCQKSDTATMNSILKCRCATVYGTENLQLVVCGGTPAQPNAYFWSGNHSYMDPTYFPAESYNLAGANATEYITGFGEQQAMLIIFKERSIGKSKAEVQTIASRDYINLPYTPVNDLIGCDLPKTIQLINNNLVFANTQSGVYCLMDTSSANENNVKRLSRNVNGSGIGRGLLYDVREAIAPVAPSTTPNNNEVTSFDDNQRYWIVANGHAYLWDYLLAGYTAKEENLSWFYFSNINAKGWFAVVDQYYYMTSNGSLSKFVRGYHDYTYIEDGVKKNGPILRRYVFATQFFGTYEVLKDVLKVIFAVRSDTRTYMTITYMTDWERRQDLTDIDVMAWLLVPRDLRYRCLQPLPYAFTAVRIPRCFHIKHFQMKLENNTVDQDMSLVSAQIIYRYSREEK